MRVDLHVWLHEVRDETVERKLDQILAQLGAIKAEEDQMSDQIVALTQRVAEVESVDQSAIVLIQGLATQIAAIKDDPVAIQALADRLNAKSAELAAAVTANTPPTP